MPISDCNGGPAGHWKDVLNIIKSVAERDGFDARLVSDTMESNLIHKEILQNLYKDKLIICDVSGRNPNVFFELGVRMATQKPTIVVKDDKTVYPFDIAPARFVEYPHDLRHPGMEKFKKSLSESIATTANHEHRDSFIGALGSFTVPDVENSEIPAAEAIIQKLDQIDGKIASLHQQRTTLLHRSSSNKQKVVIKLESENSARIDFTGYSEPQLHLGCHTIRSQLLDNSVEILYIEVPENIQSVHLTTKDNNKLSVDELAEMIVSAVEKIKPV